MKMTHGLINKPDTYPTESYPVSEAAGFLNVKESDRQFSLFGFQSAIRLRDFVKEKVWRTQISGST